MNEDANVDVENLRRSLTDRLRMTRLFGAGSSEQRMQGCGYGAELSVRCRVAKVEIEVHEGAIFFEGEEIGNVKAGVGE